MEKKLELLAPAGSFESLKAAVRAGADAVYMGGSRFGARAYANNPEGAALLQAVDYAHLHGIKLYLTINTLLKERELEQELYEYLLPCLEHGLDAVIVQDLGVLRAVREWFPDLPIHASTQMTLCGIGGARMLKEAGAQRIVLARELSLGEIAGICQDTGLEIECFVHGALCYCYSGQCLFSSILGGRSGNRGRCAQPCRLTYEAKSDRGGIISGGPQPLLSPKDICTVDLLPKIIRAGVHSLKIEGRMKRPEYTAGVVRIYRKYVDWYLQYGDMDYHVSEEDRKELLLLFNRDGFSRGYYEQHNGRELMALSSRKPDNREKRAYEALLADLRREYVETEQKLPVAGILYAEAGRPMRLDLRIPVTTGEMTEKNHSNDPETGLKTGSGLKALETRIESNDSETGLKTGSNLKALETRIESNDPETGPKAGSGLKALEIGMALNDSETGSGTESDLKDSGNTVGLCVTVYGDCPQIPKSHPMELEQLFKQMNRTGNTPFDWKSLEIRMEGPLFVPVQALNQLRRKGFSKLQEEILGAFRQSCPEVQAEELSAEEDRGHQTSETSWKHGAELHISVETGEQLAEVLAWAEDLQTGTIPLLKAIYIEAENMDEDLEDLISRIHEKNLKAYVMLPVIFRKRTLKRYETKRERWVQLPAEGYVIRNLEEFVFLREIGWKGEQILDHNIYTCNKRSRAFWREKGIRLLNNPLELNNRELAEVSDRDSIQIIYGRYPMMVSAGCLHKTLGQCRRKTELWTLKDRYQKEFPVRNLCRDCYNIIYNSQPVYLPDLMEKHAELIAGAYRVMFTTEGREEVKRVLTDLAGQRIREKDFTRGHFKRGVE